MLLELTVANFAIIEQLHLRFTPSFNVVTGETGAGKSMLIDALGMLLGGKATSEVVRTGAEAARVEGVFALPHVPDGNEDGEQSITALLGEYGLADGEGTIILTREVHQAGRSVARVNGRAVPLAVLQQIGRGLVDIYGQGEHQSLLRVGQHGAFLDHYAGLTQQRLAFRMGVAELRAVKVQIEALLQDERTLARRVDLLRHQVDEIRGAALMPGEDEELAAERMRLSNAVQLAEGAETAYRLLRGGIADNTGALDALGEALGQVEQLARVDPSLSEQRRAIEEASYQLEDAAQALRQYRDNVEHNPQRLETIEERLNLLRSLKRKYGNSIEDILRFAGSSEAELDGIMHNEEQLEKLRRRGEDVQGRLAEVAEELAQGRITAAQSLAQAMEQQLAALAMAGTRFHVALTRSEAQDGLRMADGRSYAYDSTGVERVEFLIAPNPGEPLHPLAKTASGGETSRLMLALKTILVRADTVPTLIFDEIDAGIGGRSGQVVGGKLWNLAAGGHQVLCITHLPQIACYGDAHFHVNKRIVGERTVTEVRVLVEEERVTELATMLGGVNESEKAKDNARDLLERCGVWKEAQAHRFCREAITVISGTDSGQDGGAGGC